MTKGARCSTRSGGLPHEGGIMSHCAGLRTPEPKHGRSSGRAAWLAATAISIIGCGNAWSAEGDPNEALLKKLEKMEQRIQMLEGQLKHKQAATQASSEIAQPASSSKVQPSAPAAAAASPRSSPSARAAKAEIASASAAP